MKLEIVQEDLEYQTRTDFVKILSSETPTVGFLLEKYGSDAVIGVAVDPFSFNKPNLTFITIEFFRKETLDEYEARIGRLNRQIEKNLLSLSNRKQYLQFQLNNIRKSNKVSKLEEQIKKIRENQLIREEKILAEIDEIEKEQVVEV